MHHDRSSDRHRDHPPAAAGFTPLAAADDRRGAPGWPAVVAVALAAAAGALAGPSTAPANLAPAAVSASSPASDTASVTAPAPASPARPGQNGEDPPPPRGSEEVVGSLSGIGLEVAFPPGTSIARQETANGPALTALDGSNPPTWSMLIQPIPAAAGSPTARLQLEAIIDLQRPTPAGPLVRLRDRPVAISGRLGHLAVLRDPSNREDAFLCLAVFPRDANGSSMVLVSGRGLAESGLMGVVEATLAGIRIRGAEAVSRERGERLEQGEQTLEAMDRAVLEGLVGTGRWYRTYRIDEQGREREVGCMWVEIASGLRGSVDPNRRPELYSMAEREPGFVVRVAGRMPMGDGMVRNSQAVHWMEWDQSSEQWSVRATTRDARRSDSEALTGVRAPRSAANPRGSITVVTSRLRGATDPPAVWPVPPAMLSQPIRWVLGELLVAVDAEPGVRAWYWVDASDDRPDLTYREDRWTPEDDGGWRLESRLRPGAEPIVSLHEPDGRLRVRVTSEGLRTEPVELEELVRLWSAQGLPTGPLTNRR